jgi:predicted nucleic acid-binding protein
MNADAAVYLDSSALVKLVVEEEESEALIDHLRERPKRASCALARVEVVRAVRAQGRPAINRARQLLERISLLRLDDMLLDQAAVLDGATLRSLDAIHLAAAQTLGDGLVEVITYDQHLANAAQRIGLRVIAPG